MIQYDRRPQGHPRVFPDMSIAPDRLVIFAAEQMQDHLPLFTCHFTFPIPFKVPIICLFAFQQSRLGEFAMYECVREFMRGSEQREGESSRARIEEWEIRE